MGLFNDFGKRIGQTSQSILNKANQMSDMSKINGRISEEEKSITLFYQQLGEEYYKKYMLEENEFSAWCHKISESQAKISELKVQLAAIKKIKICQKCGAECDSNTLFCGSCGTAFPVEQEKGTVVCECGQTIKSDAAFCPFCGKKNEVIS